MHTMQIVYEITKHDYIRLVRELIFMGLHRFSQFTGFYPCQVGRQTRNLAITLDMFATIIL
ncbi:MAG: hypothetical protein OXI63_21355 [Candidatus Poribacteria bacterium]|nr:hypothetical protein [Candidatus Poribacteria bacterium]